MASNEEPAAKLWENRVQLRTLARVWIQKSRTASLAPAGDGGDSVWMDEFSLMGVRLGKPG